VLHGHPMKIIIVDCINCYGKICNNLKFCSLL